MNIKLLAQRFNKPEEHFNKRLDGRIEWVCEHGVGHTVYIPHKQSSYSHGCDSCCHKLQEKNQQ